MSTLDSALPIADLDEAGIVARLERVRERTLSLVAGLDWETLRQQHIPILSPMVWDLGHLAHFEELWLCQQIADLEPLQPEFASMFDAVSNPRPTRKDLPLPVARSLWSYMSQVRQQAIEVLHDLPAVSRSRSLLEHGFVYELVAEHEEQHQETVLQLLQVLDSPSYLPAVRRRLPEGRDLLDTMVVIPAGAFSMGRSGPGFAYDNESPAHEMSLPAFLIDKAPVSCGQYLEFIEDRGYSRSELWSRSGWQWLESSGAVAPGNWHLDEGVWRVRHMDTQGELDPDLPVVHVCYYEAEAFARWAGKRLSLIHI